MERCEYLIIVATELEEKILRLIIKDRLGKSYIRFRESPRFKQPYIDLGYFSNARVYATRCQMGSDTINGSLISTALSIIEFQPTSVIMAGVAFGVSHELKIGTILIGNGIWPYDLNKTKQCKECGGKHIKFRSSPIKSSKKLIITMEKAEVDPIGWTVFRVK